MVSSLVIVWNLYRSDIFERRHILGWLLHLALKNSRWVEMTELCATAKRFRLPIGTTFFVSRHGSQLRA
jgi:hypothetical protein